MIKLAYIENGRVVFGPDNRTAPVTAPSTPSPSPAPSNSSFSPIGQAETSNPLNNGSYNYGTGSASGPLTYQQQQQAQQTGSAYITPASGGGSVQTQQPSTMSFEQFQQFMDLYNKNKQPDYQSILSQDINDQIKQLLALQKQGYKFDPETDQALKVAQNQSMNKVKQDMVASGRLYSSFTDTQQQQAAQGLIPQYEQIARQNYQNDMGNTLQTLTTLQNMDNINYNRYRDTVADSNTANTTAYNWYQDQVKNDAMYGGIYNGGLTPDAQTKASTIAKNTADIQETARKNELDAADKEAARTGWYIDPQVKQMLSAPIPAQYIPVVQQYSNDFAGEINRRASINPSDPLIPILEAARYQKVMNDPALREKYMSDYYTQTLEGKKSAADIQGKQFDNIIKQTEAEIALATAPAKAEKILLEVDKIKMDIQKGVIDIQEGIARVNDIRVQTSLRPIQVSIAQQNANTSSYNAETSRINANTGIYNAETSRNNSDRQQDEFDYRKDQDLKNPKASASFNEIYNKVGSVIDNMGENAKYITTPASVENRQIYTTVMNAVNNKLITASEGEAILNTYNIPY